MTDTDTSSQELINMIVPEGKPNAGQTVQVSSAIKDDALAKGYVEAPNPEQAAIAADVKDQETAPYINAAEQETKPAAEPLPALDKDIVAGSGGKLLHMVNPDGEVKQVSADLYHDAIAKNYKLLSTAQDEYQTQQKNNELSKQYVEKFGQDQNATTTFLQNAANPGGVLDSAYNAGLKAVGLSDVDGPEFQTAAWQAVPERFRGYLYDRKVPESDLPAAVQAMEQLEQGHSTAATAGGITGSLVENIPIAIATEGVVNPITAKIVGKGLVGGAAAFLGRAGVRTIANTLAFNGPDALKTAIVDKDPGLAVDNLLQGAKVNGIINLVAPSAGWLLGKGVGAAGNLVKGLGSAAEDVAPEVSHPVYDTIAKGLNKFPGVGDIDPVQADFLRKFNYDESDISDLTNRGAKGEEINDIYKRLPESELDEQNTKQLGRSLHKLGKDAGTEIGSLTEKLDLLSEPKSGVEIPEAHALGTSEEDFRKGFVHDMLSDEHTSQVQQGKVDQSLDTWKTSPEGLKYTKDLNKQIDAIKNDQMTIDQYKEERLKQAFNQTYPDLDATKNPEEFYQWRNSSHSAEIRTSATDDYFKMKNFTRTPTVNLADDNYNARADGNKLLQQIDEHLKDATHGTEKEAFLTNTRKFIEKNMDENGKISPTHMKEINTEVNGKIQRGIVDEVNGLKKTIAKAIGDLKDQSNAAIAGAVGDTELMDKLAYANKSYQIASRSDFGVDLRNNSNTGGSSSIGSRGGVSPRYAAFQAVRKGIAPWYKEFWGAKLNRAQLRVAKNPLSSAVINDSQSWKKVLARIPAALAAVANNEINKNAIRKENEKFDGLKVLLGDEANGLTKTQQYNRVLERLNNPSVMQDQIQLANQITDGDSKLSAGVAQKIAAMHKFLSDAIKPLDTPQPFQKNKPISPTQEQLNKINDTVRLINDPEELFKDYQAGTLTPEKVALVKAVSPAAYASMMQQANLEANNIELSLQDRYLYSILGGTGVDPSLNLVKQLQSVAAQSTTPLPQSSGKTRSHSGSKEGAASYATGSQKVNSGAQ